MAYSDNNLIYCRTSANLISRQYQKYGMSNMEMVMQPAEDLSVFFSLPIYPQTKRPDTLPSHIEEAIIDSEFLLKLSEDWNGSGSVAVNEVCYTAAIGFLKNYSKHIFNSGVNIESPEIDACPNGSIDLFWDCANATLLINFRPTDHGIYAFFYGQEIETKHTLKGSVGANDITYLAEWMKEWLRKN